MTGAENLDALAEKDFVKNTIKTLPMQIEMRRRQRRLRKEQLKKQRRPLRKRGSKWRGRRLQQQGPYEAEAMVCGGVELVDAGGMAEKEGEALVALIQKEIRREKFSTVYLQVRKMSVGILMQLCQWLGSR